MNENNMEIVMLSKDAYTEITTKIVDSIVEKGVPHVALTAILVFSLLSAELFNKKSETEETEKP